MRRLITTVAAMLLALVILAGPASAHILVVDSPGGDTTVWVGTNPEVLFETPAPFMTPDPFTLFAPHALGLNDACYAIREHGNGTVDIFGPPTPADCPHGT